MDCDSISCDASTPSIYKLCLISTISNLRDNLTMYGKLLTGSPRLTGNPIPHYQAWLNQTLSSGQPKPEGLLENLDVVLRTLNIRCNLENLDDLNCTDTD